MSRDAHLARRHGLEHVAQMARHRREELETLLAECDEFGLTFRELHERSGIPIPTLNWWATKLRRERELSELQLVRVDIVEEPVSSRLVIEVGTNARVAVEPDFDEGHLGRVRDLLLARC